MALVNFSQLDTDLFYRSADTLTNNEFMNKNKIQAPDFLKKAVEEMADRASQRDDSSTTGSSGERSMESIVNTFNALTGHSLTEAEGWEFMVILKLVRGRKGAFREDDYVDASAYCALLGECASEK